MRASFFTFAVSCTRLASRLGLSGGAGLRKHKERKTMKNIKFIAAYPLLTSAGASFSHKCATHAHAAAFAKEQAACDIAGSAAAVQHTVTVLPRSH